MIVNKISSHLPLLTGYRVIFNLYVNIDIRNIEYIKAKLYFVKCCQPCSGLSLPSLFPGKLEAKPRNRPLDILRISSGSPKRNVIWVFLPNQGLCSFISVQCYDTPYSKHKKAAYVYAYGINALLCILESTLITLARRLCSFSDSR